VPEEVTMIEEESEDVLLPSRTSLRKNVKKHDSVLSVESTKPFNQGHLVRIGRSELVLVVAVSPIFRTIIVARGYGGGRQRKHRAPDRLFVFADMKYEFE
jgi:hypothetical protein